jgi:hypothetical protein
MANTKVVSLVSRYINYACKHVASAESIDDHNLKLSFRLSLKAHDDDHDILKEFPDGEIVYRVIDDNKKPMNLYFKVNSDTFTRPTLGYPRVSNRKHVVVKRTYSLQHFIDVQSVEEVVYNEHFKMFKNYRANCVLKEITEKTAKWNLLTSSGDSYEPHEPERLSYGERQFNAHAHKFHVKGFNVLDDVPF